MNSTTSRTRIMKTGRCSSSTTGICRKPPTDIILSAEATDERTERVSGSGVITSPIGSAAGFLPRSTTRKSTSRSVKMPVILLFRVPSSVMTTQLQCSLFIMRMASVTVVWGDTVSARRTGSTATGSRRSAASNARSLVRGGSK